MVAKWKKIYWDEFIPFAHGVRRLATYYNDAVQPEDPYEFVGLLRDQPLLAAQRNHAIGQLAHQLAANDSLRSAVEHLLAKCAHALHWPAFRNELRQTANGAEDFYTPAGVGMILPLTISLTFDMPGAFVICSSKTS